ncbi:unnamed protein product [Rotaria sordida]|uniref:Runt domain-containing protein n=1 Tax=Rotaria sordida TaxID=392033 RepID=A0A814CBB3_9BILA|nr:unnamed protein product [Rotaria sordida]
MAYERRRLSTESDKSSTSTNHSNESTKNDRNLVHPINPNEEKLSITTSKKSSNTDTTKHYPTKRSSTMSSPAEQILARTKNTFVDLNPYFQCSSLPSHWRKNKSLRFILRTKSDIEVKANTRVVILAGNDYNPCATLKNNISWFRGGQAEFNDLRFLGASGRGKKFTLTIIIETNPPQQCTYRRAIKITVDGPRKKRESKPKSDVNDIQADESNIEGDSDNDTQGEDNSMVTETKPTVTQGSSGLLLLAAAAEQKRKDEEDEPINNMDQSSDCLSPTSSLASQFSHSIIFSPTSDDLRSHITRHVFLPNQTTLSNSPTTNIILSLTSNQNHFDFFHHHHQQQRHDQQTIVATSNASSTSNASTTSSNHLQSYIIEKKRVRVF